MPTIGLDSYAGDGNGSHPDWATSIRDGHLRVAAMQAVYGTVKSSVFDSYRAQLRALGIPVTGYLFLRWPGAGIPSSATQAKALLQTVGSIAPNEMPPVIDMEGVRPAGVSVQDAVTWMNVAVETVRSELGYYPGIYTSRVVCLDPASMAGADMPWMQDCWQWVKYWPYPVGAPAVTDPQTVAKLSPPALPPQCNGQWAWHQYMGDATHFPGLIGKCDVFRVNEVGMGATGGTVEYIQKRVKVAVDGSFGVETHNAVAAFQRANGLVADGEVGRDSWAFLAKVPV